MGSITSYEGFMENRWWYHEGTIDLDSEAFKKFNEAMYRKDTRTGHGWQGNAPSYFRRDITRNQRFQDSMVLRQINKGNYEDYLYVPWKSDAGYDY